MPSETSSDAVSSFSQHYPGNDQRYVDNVIDVRYSAKESLIRSLESGRLRSHRKLPLLLSLLHICGGPQAVRSTYAFTSRLSTTSREEPTAR